MHNIDDAFLLFKKIKTKSLILTFLCQVHFSHWTWWSTSSCLAVLLWALWPLATHTHLSRGLRLPVKSFPSGLQWKFSLTVHEGDSLMRRVLRLELAGNMDQYSARLAEVVGVCVLCDVGTHTALSSRLLLGSEISVKGTGVRSAI